MKLALLAALLAVPASAQTGLPGYDKAASTETATVETSSSTAPSEEATGRGVKIAGDEPKKKIVRPMHAVIHKDAVDWEPIGLKAGGVPGAADNAVALKVVKIKGRMKGENSPARSAARLYKGKKDSRWLVISVYPRSLEKKRTHFELRFRIFEGFVEEVEAAAIIITDRRRQKTGRLLDSWDLREQAIEYQSERPGSGMLVVAELDPRLGAAARNSGRLEKAEFPGSDFGFVNLSWSSKGVR